MDSLGYVSKDTFGNGISWNSQYFISEIEKMIETSSALLYISTEPGD
jgi:hypothetical protein